MNYQDLIKDVDYSKPGEVIKCGLSFLQNDELINEQKLYALGLLLNKNKERYINELKNKYESKCNECVKLKVRIEELEKGLILNPPKEEHKKKVVIKVKKNG